MEKLKNTRGLVLDLRFNGGGGEDLALPIAGRFTDVPRVYSSSRYRNGRRHDQLTPKLPRKFQPKGPWRYEQPVAVLCFQKTMSLAESFVLMLAQCPQVTTFGDRTAGSSANPRRLDLPGEITVNLPRWIDLDPAGRPIDGTGPRPCKVRSSSSARSPWRRTRKCYSRKPNRRMRPGIPRRAASA